MVKIGSDKAIFIAKKMKEELVYNMSQAEGNPLSPIEVNTLINGIGVGGHKLEDIDQVRRIINAWDEVIKQVQSGRFEITKENLIFFNALLAKDEALEVGGFRTGAVTLNNIEDYIPPKAEALDEKFQEIMKNFLQEENIEHKALSLFLDLARTQLFWDGNKRTAQIIMNGFLMMQGYSLVSISPKYNQEYNKCLKHFYNTGEKEEILKFLGKLVVQPGMHSLAELDNNNMQNNLIRENEMAIKNLPTVKKEFVLDLIKVEDNKENDITECLTEKGKLQYVAKMFHDEAFYANNLKRFNNSAVKIIEDHMQGLPGYFDVPYEYDDDESPRFLTNSGPFAREYAIDATESNIELLKKIEMFVFDTVQRCDNDEHPDFGKQKCFFAAPKMEDILSKLEELQGGANTDASKIAELTADKAENLNQG